MYPSSDLHLNYETDNAVYFFTAPFEPLNNFSPHTVSIWGESFNTLEHAYHWKKFEITDPVTANAIQQAGSPWQALKIAHASSMVRTDWDTIKTEVMYELLVAKVAQHEDVREVLHRTGNKTIVENSPVDSFWGCGADGKGENWSGKLLMKVRDQQK